jgi:hypothetical protein
MEGRHDVLRIDLRRDMNFGVDFVWFQGEMTGTNAFFEVTTMRDVH